MQMFGTYNLKNLQDDIVRDQPSILDDISVIQYRHLPHINLQPKLLKFNSAKDLKVLQYFESNPPTPKQMLLSHCTYESNTKALEWLGKDIGRSFEAPNSSLFSQSSKSERHLSAFMTCEKQPMMMNQDVQGMCLSNNNMPRL